MKKKEKRGECIVKEGYLHIYCGDGKGKTTAATGLAIRAAGSGMRVLFARFLKNETSSEVSVLRKIPNIEILTASENFGFYRSQDEAVQAQMRAVYRKLWDELAEKAQTGKYQLLVIDEFMAADRYGLFPHEAALQFLKKRPKDLEVVLTGRDPKEDVLELADYISEVQKRRHPYDRKVAARKGIEF